MIDPAVTSFSPSGITFSPRGRYILLDRGAFDPYLYDLQSRSGRLINTDYVMNSQVLLGYLVRFSPDERYLAFCLHDDSIFLYDLQAGDGKRIFGTGNPTAAAFSDDSQWLLLGTQTGIASYDLTQDKLHVNHPDEDSDNRVSKARLVSRFRPAQRMCGSRRQTTICCSAV